MMRKGKKIALWIAAGLVVAGIVICGSAWKRMGYDMEQMNLTEYRDKTYTVDGTFRSVDVCSSDDVTLEYVPSQTCAVVCREAERVTYTVTAEDGVLTVRQNDTRRWYDYIGYRTEIPTIRLLLPEDTYDSLTVTGSVGDVEAPQAFSFADVRIQTDTGNVRLYSQVRGTLSVLTDTGDVTVTDSRPQTVSLQTHTGDIRMQSVHAAQDVTLLTTTGEQTVRDTTCRGWTAQSDTGDVYMTQTTATGDLRITTETGDVTLDACDAASLELRTDTGDVTGTLLTEKVFYAQSDTGSVQVPQTIGGGRCVIETNTGDVTMRVSAPAEKALDK